VTTAVVARRTQRLTHSHSIRNLIRRGSATRGTFATAYFLSDTQPQRIVVRAAVIVSKRISKKAVSRNRLKRIAREFFRQQEKKWKVAGMLALVYHNAEATRASSQTLIDDFNKLAIKQKTI